MDPLLMSGLLLLGWAGGYVLGFIRANAHYEAEFKSLRERVYQAEESLAELEQQEQPKIEARILERMYRK